MTLIHGELAEQIPECCVRGPQALLVNFATPALDIKRLVLTH